MAGENNWQTFRDGDSNVPSGTASSPWHDGGWQTGLNRIPVGGAGVDVGGGDGVYVRHVLTVVGSLGCGNSPPSTPWAPPAFSATGGTTATDLPDGDYRASYLIVSPNGQTSVGGSETAAVTIERGVSKPRVTFAAAPPKGCTYSLILTEAGGASGTGREYCYGITSRTVDLASGRWTNPYSGGVAAEGQFSRSFDASVEPDAIRSVAALVVESSGRLVLSDGCLLTVRGDWLFEGTATGVDWVTREGSGTFGFDGSLAPDAPATEYRVIDSFPTLYWRS